jgi:hypothetical protein
VAAIAVAAASLLAVGCSSSSDAATNTTAPVDAVATDPGAVAVDTSPTIPAQTSGAPRDITIVGDSISVGAKEEYKAVMPLDEVTVVATSGIKLEGQRKAITKAIASNPDVLVIELGTNDVPGYQPEFLDVIDEVLAETDAVPCVRWVTVYVPKSEQAVAAINDHLHEAVDSHPNLQLVDWFSIVQDDPSLLSDDGLHPNPAGHEFLARAVATSTATCG